MLFLRKSRLPALLCAFALLLCAFALLLCELAARPYAEMGISDDWSYIRSAQVLAATGHIVYNGWATAMIGWQLYLAAALIKLFGFSFTIVRSSTLVISLATAFLLQRTFVRAGLNEWLATFGTLGLILFPLFLLLTPTFMTDIPGLFAILVCLYSCLRALHARTSDIRFVAPAPRYGISVTPDACFGPAPFSPVQYRTWPLTRPTTLYLVRYSALPESAPAPQHLF